jgi:hypothetical protein
VDGRIGLDGATFRFAASPLELHGCLRHGHWQPPFDFSGRHADHSERRCGAEMRAKPSGELCHEAR